MRTRLLGADKSCSNQKRAERSDVNGPRLVKQDKPLVIRHKNPTQSRVSPGPDAHTPFDLRLLRISRRNSCSDCETFEARTTQTAFQTRKFQ